jgi:hypothetical protein
LPSAVARAEDSVVTAAAIAAVAIGDVPHTVPFQYWRRPVDVFTHMSPTAVAVGVPVWKNVLFFVLIDAVSVV